MTCLPADACRPADPVQERRVSTPAQRSMWRAARASETQEPDRLGDEEGEKMSAAPCRSGSRRLGAGRVDYSVGTGPSPMATNSTGRSAPFNSQLGYQTSPDPTTTQDVVPIRTERRWDLWRWPRQRGATPGPVIGAAILGACSAVDR